MILDLTKEVQELKTVNNDSENNISVEIDDDFGWFSEPNIEFAIDPDEANKGIFERIRSFFRLLFY